MNIFRINAEPFLFLKASVLALAIFSLSACNDIKEVEYKGIKSTKLQSISLNQADLRINLEYFNPNNFGVDVKETNLSVYLNDRFLGIADQPEKTQIARNASFIFPVVAHFDPLKALGSAFKGLFNKKNKITLQGTAKVGKSGVYIKVPINITEEVSLMD